jgi:serine/threonine protein kinase
MKVASDLPGRRLHDARCPRSDPEAEIATVAPDGQSLRPGGRLVAGRYRLCSLLGRGAMGRVWLAEDEVLDRPVALKQLVLSAQASDRTRKAARWRALNEARAAARVDHLGAVRIHDIVKDYGCPWIVMELLSGRTLAEAVDADGPLPVDQAAAVGLALLDVLQTAHWAGIVHRDVKPANVYLCEDGRVVLTDFGVARALDDPTPVPGGDLVGSPAYMAPEQLRGGAAGPASDLFSLGATLFAAVESRVPFVKGDVFATLTAVVEDPPAPFRRAGPLRPVIEGMLTKEPEQRFNADQARAALRGVQRDGEISRRARAMGR